MTVIDLPQTSGHKPAPATYHAPLVHFPPYNPEIEFDFDEDEDERGEQEESVEQQVKIKSRPKPVSITIMPSTQPKRTRSRTRHTQSQPCSPRPSLPATLSTTLQRETLTQGRPPLHARGASASSSVMSSPELLTSSSPSSLPRGYFSSLHELRTQPSVKRKTSLKV